MRSQRITLQRTLVLTVVLVGIVMFHPGSGEAQVVNGRLIERGSQEPVTSGLVMLLDTTFAIQASSVSNQTGTFRLEAPDPGAYYVLTEALGYQPLIDGILDLGAGGSINVELYLSPRPVELDSMIVAVERAMVFQQLEKSGFNERKTSGFGFFISPEEIQMRNPAYFGDLFRHTPGLSLVGGGSLSGTQVQFRNASIRGGVCSPPVFVDGARVNTEFGGLEEVVDIHQISAVEVYTRASNVPLEWGGTTAGCGVLLIWTR